MTDEEFEIANTQFEAWQHAEGEWVPPTNEEWAAMANPYLVTIRIAWLTMYKSRAELMGVVLDLDDDIVELRDRFIATGDFFRKMLALIESAEARLISAGYAATADKNV